MVSKSTTIEVLKQNNIKPSYARIKILEYVLLHKTHPAAEEIYCELIQEIPTLSRTTVYNTLALLSDNDILNTMNIAESEKRYDGNTSEHGHFRCTKCNKIFDFSISIEESEPKDLIGFKTEKKNIHFVGTCDKCLNE